MPLKLREILRITLCKCKAKEKCLATKPLPKFPRVLLWRACTAFPFYLHFAPDNYANQSLMARGKTKTAVGL